MQVSCRVPPRVSQFNTEPRPALYTHVAVVRAHRATTSRSGSLVDVVLPASWLV
jgi:hypothetical protein